jgi:predicted lipoprotein with Yx(FWY)xxD motif
LIAERDAVPFDVWSLVTRPGHVRQWAYQGQPLYTYSGQDPSGRPATYTDEVVEDLDPAMFDPASKNYSPKQGWRRAAFTPNKTIRVPGGISLQSLAVADGYGFVVAGSGMVMYFVPQQPRNPSLWTPVYAPGAAGPVGDFSIIERADGTHQWKYRGRLLYTFSADYTPGDINGLLAQPDARVALVYRHFMPASLSIRVLPMRGPMMTTATGLSVYSETRQKLQYGGRETRGGYRYSYDDAKAVGTRGCVGVCTQQWRPVHAPAHAKAGGFWEIATRDDGSRQWVYRGSPLYTFRGDRRPGDIDGNNRHVIVYGDVYGKVNLSITGGDAVEPKNFYGNFGSGFYWHTVGLYN